jgi:quinoprotein glucose dehydrogenase
LSPTQPFSALTFQPKALSEKDMWGITPIDQLWCRVRFRQYRYEGIFTPQTPNGYGSLLFPGHYGVFNWGGVAVDEGRDVMIVNPNYIAYFSHLIRRSALDAKVDSAQLPHEVGSESSGESSNPSPFNVDEGPFLSPLDIPCNAPPWGELAAINLRTSRVLWRREIGTTRDRAYFGLAAPLGVPSLGGPILMGGGLVFIGATIDDYLRAFDAENGQEVWRGRLPAGGQATPMTYVSEQSERQFVVIAAGGHSGIGSKQGDYVVAFALPKPDHKSEMSIK